MLLQVVVQCGIRALFTITVESGRISTGSVQKVFSKHGHVDLLTVITY